MKKHSFKIIKFTDKIHRSYSEISKNDVSKFYINRLYTEFLSKVFRDKRKLASVSDKLKYLKLNKKIKFEEIKSDNFQFKNNSRKGFFLLSANDGNNIGKLLFVSSDIRSLLHYEPIKL